MEVGFRPSTLHDFNVKYLSLPFKTHFCSASLLPSYRIFHRRGCYFYTCYFQSKMFLWYLLLTLLFTKYDYVLILSMKSASPNSFGISSTFGVSIVFICRSRSIVFCIEKHIMIISKFSQCSFLMGFILPILPRLYFFYILFTKQ